MEAKVRKYNRWIPVLAGIAIQLCLGTPYIWGVFRQPVIDLGWSTTDAALTYSLLLGVLTFGSMTGGKLLDRLSPRVVLIIGGVIMSAGFFVAGLARPEAPWVLWATYGLVGGFGMGMAYSTVISTCQKWFPDKRGLVTGIIVAALGAAGLLFTPLASAWVASIGVMATFRIFALIFLVVTVISALVTKAPPAGYVPAGWTPPVKKEVSVYNFRPSQALRTPQYYMVTIAMLLACAAGLMVIPYAKSLGLDQGIPADKAALGVMIISVFNAGGRLFWGWASDRMGRKKTLLLLMIIAAVGMSFAAIAPGYLVFVVIAVVGFSYGGFLGVFPAITADYFGVKHVGINYGMVMLGFGIAAVSSSYLAAALEKASGGLLMPFLIAAGAAVAAAVITAFLKPPKPLEQTESK
jgi:OFA family oxalate/formate antiporter-like MFS transporter